MLGAPQCRGSFKFRVSRGEMSKIKLGYSPNRSVLLAASALWFSGCGGAVAAEDEENTVLLKKLEKMEQRIQLLEAELKQKKSGPPADAAEKPAARSTAI